jgi:transcriptional regulator with XRE-family HTH domain
MKSDQSSLQELLLAIGKKIRSERERLGYTQEQLAVKAGFHRTYIGSVERGEQNITLESCVRFADALDLRVFDLMQNTLLKYSGNSQDE